MRAFLPLAPPTESPGAVRAFPPPLLPHRLHPPTESPGNSGLWFTISAKMHPMDHTSTGVE